MGLKEHKSSLAIRTSEQIILVKLLGVTDLKTELFPLLTYCYIKLSDSAFRHHAVEQIFKTELSAQLRRVFLLQRFMVT